MADLKVFFQRPDPGLVNWGSIGFTKKTLGSGLPMGQERVISRASRESQLGWKGAANPKQFEGESYRLKKIDCR